jgi:hypothetical protein
MAPSHCHPWRQWSDTSWVRLTRLWPHSFLLCLCWFCWNWYSDYLQVVIWSFRNLVDICQVSGVKCSTHRPQHTASPLFISRALNGIYTHARFIFLSFLEHSMQWNRRGRLLHAQGLQQVQKRLQVLAKFRDSLQSQGAGNLIDVFVWNPRSQFLYLYLLHWLTKGYLWYKMTSVSEAFQRLFAVKDDCCQCMWLLF